MAGVKTPPVPVVYICFYIQTCNKLRAAHKLLHDETYNYTSIIYIYTCSATLCIGCSDVIIVCLKVKG